MNLNSDIAQWDMKSAGDIQLIYENYANTPKFVDQIALLLAVPSMQRGASWLLKRHVADNGNSLEKHQHLAIYQTVDLLEHWETKLHILQCMAYLPVPLECRNNVEKYVRDCLSAERKFVRAWAYSGFHSLAVQFPELQDEAVLLLNTALKQESAGSVKSRINRAIKLGF